MNIITIPIVEETRKTTLTCKDRLGASIINQIVRNIKRLIKFAFSDGYKCIALNTTIDGSVLGVGTSNRRKRKNGSSNLIQEPDWVPDPPFKEVCISFNRGDLNFHLSAQFQ